MERGFGNCSRTASLCDGTERRSTPQQPAANASIEVKAKYAERNKTNRMAILIMTRSISPSVKGVIPSSDNAKAFLKGIGEKFQESKKVEIGDLMGQLTDLKYDGEGCVRVHITKMLGIGNKLRSLDVNVDEAMMVILQSTLCRVVSNFSIALTLLKRRCGLWMI